MTPAGSKLSRLRYEFEREEELISIGPYSAAGLADAREAATNARRLLREGRDPAVEKRLRRLGEKRNGYLLNRAGYHHRHVPRLNREAERTDALPGGGLLFNPYPKPSNFERISRPISLGRSHRTGVLIGQCAGLQAG